MHSQRFRSRIRRDKVIVDFGYLGPKFPNTAKHKGPPSKLRPSHLSKSSSRRLQRGCVPCLRLFLIQINDRTRDSRQAILPRNSDDKLAKIHPTHLLCGTFLALCFVTSTSPNTASRISDSSHLAQSKAFFFFFHSIPAAAASVDSLCLFTARLLMASQSSSSRSSSV